LTLLKNNYIKKSFFSCGKQKESNTKKIYSVTLTSDILTDLTNKSLLSGKDAIVPLDNFIVIDAAEFIKILKQLTSLGIDD
jgi:hypothetical protein